MRSYTPSGIVLCLAVLVSPAVSVYAQQPQVDVAAEREMVDLINQERARHQLPPLQVDPRLTAAARKHSELMAQNNTLSHQFSGEPAMDARFSAEELASNRQGENVSLAPSVAASHDGLMHSPPHRANLLNAEYNVVGVGIVQSGHELWVTEDFARSMPEYSEPQAEAVLEQAIAHYVQQRGMPSPERKPQQGLRKLACEMARNDALNPQAATGVAGVQEAFVWTAGDPADLPANAKTRLANPMPSGYSLGACFAPSVSHPGGGYWVVMVVY